MSGITAQSVMRRKFGIVVCHVKTSAGYQSQVLHRGNLVFESPDDCLATGSVVLTNKIWHLLMPKCLVTYEMQPAYAYLQGKNVMAAMKDFDQDEFERDLLPRMRKEETLKGALAVYDANRGQVDESETYLLYDALVRLICYARQHNIKVVREGIEGMKITDAVSALTDHGAVCIDVTDSAFRAALDVIHAGASETTIGGKTYLVKDVPINTYSCVKGDLHLDLPPELADKLVSGCEIRAISTPAPLLGHLDDEEKQTFVSLVGTILGQGGVGVTPEEKALIGYGKSVCGTGKLLGKNSLPGLGNVVAEGPLAERLDVLYQELSKKVRGLLSAQDTYRLAASKLACMNSAKVVVLTGGTVYVKDRIPTVMVGQDNCLA